MPVGDSWSPARRNHTSRPSAFLALVSDDAGPLGRAESWGVGGTQWLRVQGAAASEEGSPMEAPPSRRSPRRCTRRQGHSGPRVEHRPGPRPGERGGEHSTGPWGPPVTVTGGLEPGCLGLGLEGGAAGGSHPLQAEVVGRRAIQATGPAPQVIIRALGVRAAATAPYLYPRLPVHRLRPQSCPGIPPRSVYV